MMPRHFTEEICQASSASKKVFSRFNDASAFHRGNRADFLGILAHDVRFNDASAFHRGNRDSCQVGHDAIDRFNDASAFHRGNRGGNTPHWHLVELGFNDASAFHRGNRHKDQLLDAALDQASMMPRHFTEEIGVVANALGRLVGASMMPRHFTEEIDGGAAGHRVNGCASMMPRHFTEEIGRLLVAIDRGKTCFNDASAFHRGNPSQANRAGDRLMGFNDASAFHRGNPGDLHVQQQHQVASMMPRHFTEEICLGADTSRPLAARFNDASAFHRGNPTVEYEDTESNGMLQ